MSVRIGWFYKAQDDGKRVTVSGRRARETAGGARIDQSSPSSSSQNGAADATAKHSRNRKHNVSFLFFSFLFFELCLVSESIFPRIKKGEESQKMGGKDTSNDCRGLKECISI